MSCFVSWPISAIVVVVVVTSCNHYLAARPCHSGVMTIVLGCATSLDSPRALATPEDGELP